MSNRYIVPVIFTYQQKPIPSESVNQNNAAWAAAVNELVDDFRGASPPDNPVEGMTWLDTSGARPVHRIYEGGVFRWYGIDSGTSSEKPENPRIGAIYFDTDNNLPQIYNGSTWEIFAINSLEQDPSPTLGGNLTIGVYTVGDATASDLTKLHEITVTSTDLNTISEKTTGPALSTDGGIAVFDGTTGKVLKDAGFVPVDGPDSSTDGGVVIFDGTTGKVLKDAGFEPIKGPASSTDGGIAVFDGTTGKVLKDAGFEPIKGPASSTDGGIAVFDGTTGKLLKDSGFRPIGYDVFPIGVPIPVWDHLPITKPPNSGSGAIFIKLTAGENGEGGYNYGLLTGETVSGSAPLVKATAIVDLLDSPLYGQAVHLINTEEAFLRARTTSGQLQYDQMQKIIGSFNGPRSTDLSPSGAFSGGAISTLNTYVSTTSSRIRVMFDSAGSPYARTSSTTSGETRSKNVSATWYLRIK